ncbi:muts domain V-domain-containing protein [Chaetomium strumarium]|uniref:DNA mismatch repair protein MSH3 n=1 Tax=Chaetomium strumarium TaxID=1170767 RepID=A0AAJ0M5Q8_9PEZI|nr:muts domain V-domain-containing protein [Chaetomium strumarium]
MDDYLDRRAPRGSSSGAETPRFGCNDSDWLRKSAITRAMVNAMTEPTSEGRSAQSPRHHTAKASPDHSANDFSGSSIGDPNSWLLPHPFRQRDELPLFEQTPNEESEEVDDNWHPHSAYRTQNLSNTGTPVPREAGRTRNSTKQSPYFLRAKDFRTLDPIEEDVASSLHGTDLYSRPAQSRLQENAGNFATHSSDRPTYPETDMISPRHSNMPQHQHHRHTQHALNTQYDVVPSTLGSETVFYTPSSTRRGQLVSPDLSQSPGSEFEGAVTPSVISRAVTHTLTPTTSPYRRDIRPGRTHDRSEAANEVPGRGTVLRTFADPRHDTRQDSSILSPLARPTDFQYLPRSGGSSGGPLHNAHLNREEDELMSIILSLDLSSDSESDDDDMLDSRPAVRRVPDTPDNRGLRGDSSELGEEQDSVVCAISESRSSDIIGVAVINATVGQVDLFRVVNDDKYWRLVETLGGMETRPQTFLVLKSVIDGPNKSSLVRCLMQEFPDVDVVPLGRDHWNESEGLRMIDRFAWRKDVKALRKELEHNFYVSCAFSAVMAYVEEDTDVIFRENSLRIKYRQPADTMGLDRATISSLELFQNTRNAKGVSSTLFGLLNNSLTPQGRRMIRSAVLQPSTNRDEIVARHEAVEELSSNEDLFTEVRASLKQLVHIDVERSIPWVAAKSEEARLPLEDGVALFEGHHQIVMSSHEDLQRAEKDLNHVLMIKAYLGGVNAIRQTLEASNCTSDLCKWVLEKCAPENTSAINELIESAVEEGATYSKAPIDVRNNRLWALKAEPNGVLERARQLYRDYTNELHQYVEELNKTFQEQLGTTPDLRLGNDNHYYFRFQWSDVGREVARHQTRLQRRLGGVETINGIRRKQYYDCQTIHLIQKSSRIQRQADIVTAQNDRFVLDLKNSLLEHAETLLSVNEATAVLDMLCSFAHLATTRNYVRPIISDNLVLKDARHPVLEVRKQNIVPNDVYSGDQAARFQVVTGGNMSGKSTFIRTIALIQILAQIGSFVPARYAAVPICDRLFTRLSTEDKPESNLGTFAVEMTEMNVILRQATKDSLIIIDELGRGTSPKEGLAIALAMSEKLIKTGSRVFFATHFTELARVLNATKRNNVLTVHISSESTKHGETSQIHLPHTVAPGPVKNEDYGLDLARLVLPDRVIKNAEPLKSTMDDSALASYLMKLQTEFTIRMDMAADDKPTEEDHRNANKTSQGAAERPVLEKPSEEEVEEWRKKCDAAERRVMHANMAASRERKRRVTGEGRSEYYYEPKRMKTDDDESKSVVSRFTPINRRSMIDEFREGTRASTTTGADTPSSFIMDISDLDDEESLAAEVKRIAPVDASSTVAIDSGSRSRAVSISSDSSVDDGIQNTVEDQAAEGPSGTPSPEPPQPQPLEAFQPLKAWYTSRGIVYDGGRPGPVETESI